MAQRAKPLTKRQAEVLYHCVQIASWKYVTAEWLAEEMEISKSQAQRHIATLTNKGYLYKDESKNNSIRANIIQEPEISKFVLWVYGRTQNDWMDWQTAHYRYYKIITRLKYNKNNPDFMAFIIRTLVSHGYLEEKNGCDYGLRANKARIEKEMAYLQILARI